MRKIILLLLCCCSFAFSQAGDISTIYRNSDLVAHIRIKTAIGDLPSSIKEMGQLGSTWYFPRYTIIKTYRQGFPLDDTSFAFLQPGYNREPPNDFFSNDKEYIVFLKLGETRPFPFNKKPFKNYILLGGGLMPYSDTLAAMVFAQSVLTEFDQAIKNAEWDKVEQLLKKEVLKATKTHGDNYQLAEKQVMDWVQSHNNVHQVMADSCAIHISIFPGWSDHGIRFLTANGPVEYVLTFQIGRIKKGRFGRSGGSDMALYFRNLREEQGAINRMVNTCLDNAFQNLRNRQMQEGIEIRTELVEDTLAPFVSVSPVIRVKLAMYNVSEKPLTVLWPARQNHGRKLFTFRLRDRNGAELIEESGYLQMHSFFEEEAVPVLLQPGDSIVAIHSINDHFSYVSDVRGHHSISAISPGEWALSVIYKPQFDDEDTTGIWIPETGFREIVNSDLLVVKKVYPLEEISVKATMLEDFVYYQNEFGQQCVYDGLVRIIEAPIGSPFAAGDTIAYSFPLFFDRNEHGQPLNENEFIAPGDSMSINLVINFPPGRFSIGAGKFIGNYLTTNDPRTIKRLSN